MQSGLPESLATPLIVEKSSLVNCLDSLDQAHKLDHASESGPADALGWAVLSVRDAWWVPRFWFDRVLQLGRVRVLYLGFG